MISALKNLTERGSPFILLSRVDRQKGQIFPSQRCLQCHYTGPLSIQ